MLDLFILKFDVTLLVQDGFPVFWVLGNYTHLVQRDFTVMQNLRNNRKTFLKVFLISLIRR